MNLAAVAATLKRDTQQGAFMSAQVTAKSRMLGTALLGAAVAVLQIYELTSATVFLALGAIALVGSLIGYLKGE